MELPPIITLLITDLLSPLGLQVSYAERRGGRRCARPRAPSSRRRPRHWASHGGVLENAARLGLGFRGFRGEGFRV